MDAGGVGSLSTELAYLDAEGADEQGRARRTDVAGHADPDSGSRIIVADGKTGMIGGTSAVAPLLAGIVAGMNAHRGKPIGDVHAVLYQNAGAFRDITSGNNRHGSIGYSAQRGWDPCTGLGSPIGAALRKLLD